MILRVEYLYARGDPKSQCWALMPMSIALDDALAVGRAGLADVKEYLGAKGFLVVDETDRVVAEEWAS